MKINENGIVRDMTAEEEAEYGELLRNIPADQPNLSEKVKEIEAALLALIGGETE